MPESDILLQSLQRIEGKLDNAIVNHGERLASLEAKHESLESSVEKSEKWATYKSLITYAGVMLSHFGINKAGWKI